MEIWNKHNIEVLNMENGGQLVSDLMDELQNHSSETITIQMGRPGILAGNSTSSPSHYSSLS